MFGSDILDVAIGMALLFLFMSLIATALREMMENIIKRRSKNLEQGIKELLQTATGPQGNARPDMAKEFYTHPLIASLYKEGYKPGSRTLPSYIPRESFSLAILDILAGSSEKGQPLSLGSLQASLAAANPPNAVQRVVLSALATAEGDLDRARTTLEAWYDGTMDRVAGWYTRETSRILLGLGFAAAVFCNVDAITVAQHLLNDRTLRSSVVAEAARVTSQAPAGATTAAGGTAPQPSLRGVSDAKGELDQIGFPIGWIQAPDGWLPFYPGPQACIQRPTAATPSCRLSLSLLTVPFGWLITALAIMLGAPFWFDVLNKFMVIRSTIKPSEKSPDEASADRQSTPARNAGSGAGAASARQPDEADPELTAAQTYAAEAARQNHFVPHAWANNSNGNDGDL